MQYFQIGNELILFYDWFISLTERSRLKFEDYFNGETAAHGLVMSRSGSVIRSFVVHIKSSWVGNVGTMTENFEWSDGEKTNCRWTIKRTSENSYEGTAEDIIGKAIGVSAGGSFFWDYRMLVKKGTSSYKIRFDDRLYKVSERALLNEVTMFWFGFRVGKILISFQKP